MTTVAQEIVKANAAFAASRPTGQLPMPPARKVAIVTCMDARILTGETFGIKEGDAHIIRNAGGRVQDSIRSLVISQTLLGTEEIVVIQHTDCGMVTFKASDARAVAKQAYPDLPAESVAKLDNLDYLEFPEVKANVKADVEYLRNEPLIKTDKISGFVYSVETGKLEQVA